MTAMLLPYGFSLICCLMFDRSPNLEGDERLSVDVHDYGKFLLELIVGKSAGKDQSMIDWVRSLRQPNAGDSLNVFGVSPKLVFHKLQK